jgi:amino acid permease
MWILQWLPDWFFYALFFVGLLGIATTFLLRFIPFFYLYKNTIQAFSLLLIVIGVYMSGAIREKAAWEMRVKEMEIKLAEAQAESSKVNTEIIEKTITKTQIVKERGNDIVKYIDREVVKYDNECKIPKEFIEAHNKATTR